ncbi:MAG: 1-acyl-sn-glycerol-3-phosphate acyltransferase [Candidatus Marinimicrobia bacterium]|nr:1-acyl-sn-glycerol-3-phosphate acyltransferase [Candidatus Neomarinimicrobiota bacterium]
MSSLSSVYYWVIALSYFGPVLLIVLIRSYFQEPEAYDLWLRNRLKTLFKLINSEPRIEFAEDLPTDQPLIFMANHSSLIDIPLLKATIPAYFRGMLAHDQLHYFLYGSVVRRMKNIPIQRDNIRASLRSFEQAKTMLNQGINITVLPEGNRSLDGKLLAFRKLPFHFAKESGTTIVPIAISGVFAMKNKGSFKLKPGEIVVRFGPIIKRSEIAALGVQEIMELTRERIYSRLEPFEAGRQ